MKATVLVLAMWAGAYGPAFGVLAQQPPPHDAQRAFAFACSVLQYDCDSVPQPKVVWDSLFYTVGLFGFYNGDDEIHMDVSMLRIATPEFVDSIIAHEYVHYLDVQLGVIELPFTRENVCQSEFNAWRVSNAYVVSHGRSDLASFNWAEQYGCFQ